jgi:hypothetical protein
MTSTSLKFNVVAPYSWSIIMMVDSTQELILSNDFKDVRWARYLKVHARMRFIDTGKKSCNCNMSPWCQPIFRLVQVIAFQKL